MNVISFVVGIVLFVGGIVLFGYAWDGTVFNPWMFTAGLATITLSIVIPVHILKRVDG
ncbi:hypothetical protein [Marisediminicola senii]|uniref:hypothetical protein n=1 Tax=Marisediminicola senii TaxID=2711233 RepID=UPI0013ED7070|nr:hypothetical protein [Marisediminicola senii]